MGLCLQISLGTCPSLKEGIILELGFDQTAPYTECDISSWALDKALLYKLGITDNRAKRVPCYNPEYTFVEKLQTISTKFRQEQENEKMPLNFLRHYYDVYKLLESEMVKQFIGSTEYETHKKLRFRGKDQIVIKSNDAFTMNNEKKKILYSEEFKKKSAIYFGKQPSFDEIIARIQEHQRIFI